MEGVLSKKMREQRGEGTAKCVESAKQKAHRLAVSAKERDKLQRVGHIAAAHCLFVHDEWENFFQPASSGGLLGTGNKWKDFHLRHDPSRNADHAQAFDLIFLDPPWGVNKAAGATRDAKLTAEARGRLVDRVNQLLAEQGTVLIMTTAWELGFWQEALAKCNFRTTTAPLTVTFAASQTHRKRGQTDHYSTAHHIIVAMRSAATSTTKNLSGVCKSFMDNPFNPKCSVIGGYMPPKDRLNFSDGLVARVEEKMVGLLKVCLTRYTNDGDRVADFFGGTASLALACLTMNRSYVGCEKDQRVHQLANARLMGIVRGMVLRRELAFPGDVKYAPVTPIAEPVWSRYWSHLETVKSVAQVPPHINPADTVEEQLKADLAHWGNKCVVEYESAELGWGLKAAQDIEIGEIVGAYHGVVYTKSGFNDHCVAQRKAKRNFDCRLNIADDFPHAFPDNAVYNRIKPIIDGAPGCAMTKINCARGPTRKGPVKGVNAHIITASLNDEVDNEWRELVRDDTVEAWKFYKLAMVAARSRIAAGEWIHMDYSEEYWTGDVTDDEQELEDDPDDPDFGPI